VTGPRTRRKWNENQADQRIRGRPGQGPAARGAEFTIRPTDVTASTIAVLNDTCGNLIQLTQLARY
jgi:hypothetical protein